MPQEILSKKAKANLETLKKEGLLKDFYLAGGTGLALQLKHRVSLDFDFFTKKGINPQVLAQKIKKLGKFSIEKEAENTLIGIFQGTRITLLTYEYPLLFRLKKIEGIKVADIQDIGCMKISAISSRGTKKDFIDIFFICQKVTPFKKLLKIFERKYKSVNYNMIHVLKSLVYFEDTRKEPMPKMIVSVSWKAVEDFFRKEVKRLNKS